MLPCQLLLFVEFSENWSVSSYWRFQWHFLFILYKSDNIICIFLFVLFFIRVHWNFQLATTPLGFTFQEPCSRTFLSLVKILWAQQSFQLCLNSVTAVWHYIQVKLVGFSFGTTNLLAWSQESDFTFWHWKQNLNWKGNTKYWTLKQVLTLQKV